MNLPPLPVTVISGYLGAGKTSLINHLLRNADGRRIMVMVNDFGELNIDADLLESADEDTLTLSNGCICCTMGTELLYALSDALDRRPRPDYLVIEASGVAQPQKIAAAAHAEPEMHYCGVVTLADAAEIAGLLEDRMIGWQIGEQLTSADLILLTKTDLADETAARAAIAAIADAPVIAAPHGAASIDLLLGESPEAPAAGGHADHGHDYLSWSASGGEATVEGLRALLSVNRAGAYRFKGRVRTPDGGAEAHLVGKTFAVTPCPAPGETRVVAIGLAGRFDPEALEADWRALTGG